MKTLKTSSLFGLGSLTVLILFNLFFYAFSGLIVVSTLSGAAVFISFITLLRTILLIKLPLFILDENSIKYFNVLWYKNHQWSKFELATIDADRHSISIGLTNGRIFDKFHLDSLSLEDIERIKRNFTEKKKLIIESTVS